jgi:Tol biopolymer transport system component
MLLSIVNADGSGLRQLSKLVGSGQESAVSPDGRSIAFESVRGIFAVALNGSHLRMLVANGMINHGTWLPPNTMVGQVCSPWVGLMSTPGLQIWSPDGTRLLYVKGYYKNPFKNRKIVSREGCGRTGVAELWVTNANGGGKRRLFSAANAGFDPSGATWSPDGKRIAFTVNFFPDKHARSGLYLMDANGTHVHRLLAGILSGLTWQPIP